MEAYMCENAKAKHTIIQKFYIFADILTFFSENGSKKEIQTLKQTSKRHEKLIYMKIIVHHKQKQK